MIVDPADIPAAVQAAIAAFVPDEESGIKLIPPRPGDKSILADYGVRVLHTNTKDGAEATVFHLYGGKTSNPTRHLWTHRAASNKTKLQEDRKCTREEEVEELRESAIFKEDPTRLRLLLETRRIILNNLPFCSGEHSNALIINDLMIGDRFRTSINAKAVGRSIIEMYSSTKREVVKFLNTRQVGTKAFTLVADFWTCRPQRAKYLGVRVYFIDKDWLFRSVLLGFRLFDPTCAMRTKGFRGAFRDWIVGMIRDFDIKPAEIFGGMTDGASDVKGLMVDELRVAWEWCIPRMTNAATKAACGMTDNAKNSKNPELTALIERLRITIRQVRDVEQMGTLFEALCELEGTSKSTKLVDYQSHRFLGLKPVITRVLEKWKPLIVYYEECAKRPKASKARQTFLLAKDREVLIQILSLLTPVIIVNKLSQAEEANQVKSLLLLFKLRQVTLDPATPLRDYRSTAAAPKYIPVADLTPLAVKTRQLLGSALDSHFFSRYLDAAARVKQNYVFECHLFLHPRYKDLDENLVKVVSFCAACYSKDAVKCTRIAESVKLAVTNRIRRLMREVAEDPVTDILDEVDQSFETQEAGDLSAELAEMYASAPVAEVPAEVHETRVEEELQRWILQRPIAVDSPLTYWRANGHNFCLLSRVARVIFAFPTSSAQIERDFGDSGRMVTKERSSLNGTSVEMSAFLRANNAFNDLEQCDKIALENFGSHIPKHLLDIDDFDDELP